LPPINFKFDDCTWHLSPPAGYCHILRLSPIWRMTSRYGTVQVRHPKIPMILLRTVKILSCVLDPHSS
jgi:hypothetical protein